ncbi:hypothetical protein, partial [Aeromonas caviae]|uniref:hypothetical protein n=1 Tax=Aeromonas caviae TaxID=648 RepID=UPI0029D6DA97
CWFESTVGLKALWRRTFVTTTRILLTCPIGDGPSRHREISAFYEGSGEGVGRERVVAPLSQVVVTWVCKGRVWKTVPPVSAALTQGLVG